MGSIDELYEIETEICYGCKADSLPSEDLMNRLLNIVRSDIPDYDMLTDASIKEIFNLFKDIQIQPSLITRIVSPDVKIPSFEPNEIETAREYVSCLMQTDLSKISVINVSDLDKVTYQQAEAITYYCKDNEHYVFISPNSVTGTTTDLLCHEFGHAAETTIIRESGELHTSYHTHSLISEAIANYCQLKFLQDHSNPEMRAFTFNNFLFGYLAILVVKYCLAERILPSNIIIEDILNTPDFVSLLECYRSHSDMNFIVEKMKDNIADLASFQHIGHIVLFVVAHRSSMLIALLMLNNANLDLVTIAKNNTVRASISTLLDLCHPDYKSLITEPSKLISNYIDGVDMAK